MDEIKDEKREEKKIGKELPKGVSPEDLQAVKLDYKDHLLIKQLEMEHELKTKLKERKTEENGKKEVQNTMNHPKDTKDKTQFRPMGSIEIKKLDTAESTMPTAKKFQRQKQEVFGSQNQNFNYSYHYKM